jgi:ubiquinone/menaquinone biosynthesis C-methylase UbiE
MLNENVKDAIQLIFPRPVVHKLKKARANLKARGAMKAFKGPGPGGEYLSAYDLNELMNEYPAALPYGFDSEALFRRGDERARQLMGLMPVEGATTLELACHDGMVSGLLARSGAKAIATDLSIKHVDRRAVAMGASPQIADAGRLQYDNNSFDLVFSYNSFEHFSDPEAVLREAVRVTRPGGLLFFSFGPLYRSSYGLHAMHSITVPFCQYLWTRATMNDYVEEHGLGRIEYETLNEWSVSDFRALWSRYAAQAELLSYQEVPSIHGVELVARYPQCFREKVDVFEDLIVSVIDVCLRRTASPI